MSVALRVLAPGLATTLQDLGRLGYAHLGVPASGALDPVALRTANALVGNPPDAGALEAIHIGPTFAIDAASVRLAFTGAAAPIEVRSGLGAGPRRAIKTMQSIRLLRDDVISIGALSGGALLYIVNRESAGERDEYRLDGVDLPVPRRLRAVDGPQMDRFSPDDIAAFFANEYVVTAADRMGMRLRGAKLNHAQGHDIISEAIAPGSIQISGAGEPIVLLADRQTTGGYPKIATVISADLPALGRLPIGATIAFERVSMAQASELRRKLLAQIEAIASCMAPVDGCAGRSPNLLGLNLISGVIDART